ncbi:hypothetical protein L249_7206, partial [Ophiocordyceps polyrhachis-furcata BCC 54312]
TDDDDDDDDDDDGKRADGFMRTLSLTMTTERKTDKLYRQPDPLPPSLATPFFPPPPLPFILVRPPASIMHGR